MDRLAVLLKQKRLRNPTVWELDRVFQIPTLRLPP